MSVDSESIYSLLEEKMLRASDYTNLPVEEVVERLVQVPHSAELNAKLIDQRMQEAVDRPRVFVRWSVLQKLRLATDLLRARDATLQLEVCYGYRLPAVQEALYLERREAIEKETGLTGKALDDAVHRKIATPSVAGHPTGGAVDVHVLRDGEPLEMGTRIWDFTTKDAYTFSPFITAEAWNNRQLLRDIMIQAGFAPFDGEWWHFSYGDKEWARYYGRGVALYGQCDPEQVAELERRAVVT